MPINYNKLSTEITSFNNPNFKDIIKMCKRNNFYHYAVLNYQNWGNNKQGVLKLIKYGKNIIGFFNYNWKTSNGYVYDNKPFKKDFPSVWVDFFLIDKPYQKLGIGTYIMDKLGDMFRKEFGNHIKYICYDIDGDKPKKEILGLCEYYILKRKGKSIGLNRAGNGMVCENVNKSHKLLEEMKKVELRKVWNTQLRPYDIYDKEFKHDSLYVCDECNEVCEYYKKEKYSGSEVPLCSVKCYQDFHGDGYEIVSDSGSEYDCFAEKCGHEHERMRDCGNNYCYSCEMDAIFAPPPKGICPETGRKLNIKEERNVIDIICSKYNG